MAPRISTIQQDARNLSSSANSRPQGSAGPTPQQIEALLAVDRLLAANRALLADEAQETPWPTALKPVAKDVTVGPRGGGFYIKTHPDGRRTKVYLKEKQRRDCQEGTLIGSGITCPAAKITGYRKRGTTRAQEAATTAISLMNRQQR
jgi:exoribonuclease R